MGNHQLSPLFGQNFLHASEDRGAGWGWGVRDGMGEEQIWQADVKNIVQLWRIRIYLSIYPSVYLSIYTISYH